MLIVISIKEKVMQEKLTFAVDFDGTLCEFDFPKIGKQTENHKKMISWKIEKVLNPS